MTDRTRGADAASWILTVGQFGLAGTIALFGPTHPLPMHFNAEGQVDRWGGRGEMALFVLVLAVISAVITVSGWIGARRAPAGLGGTSARRGQAAARFVVLLVLALIALLDACLTWGWGDKPGPRFGMAMVSAILGFVGAVLGKTSPNALIGVRTPWTFQSRLAWDKANRLAGRLFFWGGLAGMLAAPFAPQPEGFQAVTFGVLAIAVIVVFESWRVWLIDPDRTR
jgi:uncharacterized membrane protein